ncbi:hypothetical protein [Endozoicomonas sp. YOMI1]
MLSVANTELRLFGKPELRGSPADRLGSGYYDQGVGR